MTRGAVDAIEVQVEAHAQRDIVHVAKHVSWPEQMFEVVVDARRHVLRVAAPCSNGTIGTRQCESATCKRRATSSQMVCSCCSWAG